MKLEDMISELRETVAGRFDYSQSLSDDSLMERIEDAVFEYTVHKPMAARQKEALIKRLFHSFRGLDVLQPLLDDPGVTEIMVNGHLDIF